MGLDKQAAMFYNKLEIATETIRELNDEIKELKKQLSPAIRLQIKYALLMRRTKKLCKKISKNTSNSHKINDLIYWIKSDMKDIKNDIKD